jgi:hypothetical protein
VARKGTNVKAERRSPGLRFRSGTGGGLIVASALMRTSGQVAGLLPGPWPVTPPWSAVGSVTVLVGHGPAEGIPAGLFRLLSAASALLLALWVPTQLRDHHRHVLVGRPSEGIARLHSFRDGHRGLVPADFSETARLTARRPEPAGASRDSLPRPEPARSLVGEQTARLLAEHFTREQPGALICELAERHMAGEALR